jgi:Topoisomerase II-associated protein PAT1
MAFFGFEQSNLEQEKLNFKHGNTHQPDNVAVYTWGEEGYDGLGDLLQEGGDELNDETFGEVGSVGKEVCNRSAQNSTNISQARILIFLILLHSTSFVHRGMLRKLFQSRFIKSKSQLFRPSLVNLVRY